MIRELGRGGTSVVYLVRHIGLNSLRVVKQIDKNVIDKSGYFVEINILKNASIQGIPIIYDVEEDEGSRYIIEEYIQGQKFSDYIIDEKRTKNELIRCIADICDIISKLHELNPYSVIYNDLKSENILIKDNKVYLVDFGNCRIVGQEFNSNMASVSNVTPEHFKEIEPDTTTDVYAIGVLIQNIYQLHRTMFEEDKDIINTIISGCMEKENFNRIRTPKVIKKYLNQCVKCENTDSVNLCELKDVINVYVYGCREYAGVTHFSIGLTKYLSEIKKKSVYIETQNGRGFTEYLDMKDVKSSGVIKFERCEIWPYYGQFVEQNTESFEGIHIYDCGVYQEEDVVEGIVIVVITDIKSFGTLRYKSFGSNNVIYVVNFSDEEGFRRFDRSMDFIVLNMPYFSNPLLLDKDSKMFYKNIYELIRKKSEKRSVI